MIPEQAAEQIYKDPWSMTLMEFVDMTAMFNAGLSHLSAMKDEMKDDQPCVAIIAVRGQQECAEVLQALDSIQTRWELQRELEKRGEGGCNG